MPRVTFRIAGIVVVVWVACLGFAVTQAQPPADPIILVVEGDLWSWLGPDQPLVQHTSWGMNRNPILSPDGTRVAYWSAARIFADWLETINGAGGFLPPTNIWMLDLPSGQTFRVADQPVDAVWDGPESPGRYALRTEPCWSPDGRQLAWVEVLIDTLSFTTGQQVGTVQLVTYDLAGGTTQVLDSFPALDTLANPDLFDVQWGAPGIAVKIGPQGNVPGREIRLYDPSGDMMTRLELDETIPGWVFSAVWIRDQGQDYLADVQTPADAWLNWRTGQIEALPGSLEMVSSNAPDAARFFFADDTWHLVLPVQAPVDLGAHIRPFGISRDGQRVVYGRWELNPDTGFYAYTLIVQSRDQLVEPGRYQNPQLVWGPVVWQIAR